MSIERVLRDAWFVMATVLFTSVASLHSAQAAEGEGEGEVEPVAIETIQGDQLTSPLVGQSVTISGAVVTAVLDNGFFVQTPANETDESDATSSGIFIATAGPQVVTARDAVTVSGQVAETNQLTQIVADGVTINSSGNSLPAPFLFDETNPAPENATPYLELEKFEGTRIALSDARVLTPTDENGRIKVLANLLRPRREPGIAFPGRENLPVWDKNPAIFSMQLDALGLNIPQWEAGSTINAIGILSQEDDDYVLYPSSLTLTEPNILDGPVRMRDFREFSAVSLNLEDFRVLSGSPEIEQIYLTRKLKTLRLIRDGLRYPDIIAFQGVQDAALTALRSDILADGGPNYVKFISESAESDGLENAFLWRQDTMILTAVEEIDQFTRDSLDTEYLFENVPMIFRGAYLGGPVPFPVRIINVDLLPANGIDVDNANGELVRRLRLEQSEFLAGLLQDYQSAENSVPTMLLGAINAFPFTDGFVDVNGILTGAIDPANALLTGADLLDPNFINQGTRLDPLDWYSAILPDGALAALDHAIADEVMDNLITDLQYLHVNAEAAYARTNESGNFFRTSRRDPLVVFVATTTDVVVDSLSDTGDNDLSPGNLEFREALAVVVPGGTIRFAPSLFNGPQTVTLDGDLGPLRVNKELRILGPGRDLLTISGDNAIRIMTVDDVNFGTKLEVLISDLTLADGETLSFEGGGIFNNERLTLRRVRIRDCEALQGGAVFSFASLFLDNCIFENNIAGVTGGAVAKAFYQDFVMMDSQLIGNRAEFTDGGGIHFDDSFLNTATIRNSTLSGNSAGRDGGGIWTNTGLFIANSTLSGNVAGGDGGGLFDQSIGGVQIAHATFTQNVADNSLSGAGNGGGLFGRFQGPTLQNCLVAGNRDRSEEVNGPDNQPDLSGIFTLDGNNVIGDGTGTGNLGGSDIDLAVAGFSSVDDVINPTLANNGGPTLTHALVPGSIAINFGDTNAAVDPATQIALTTDQRGNGFPRLISNAVDAGAFEQPVDEIIPEVTINVAEDQASPTNGFPIRFEVVFSKGVLGFSPAAIVASGTATGLSIEVSGGGSLYEVAVTAADADGTIILHVAENAAGDAFGNTNAASTSNNNEVLLDRTIPVITLLGRATESVECGTPYIEPGFTADDALQGDLTADVVVTGMVQSGLPGTYFLQYNVVDEAGNVAATVQREIVVADTTAPVIALNGPSSITIDCGVAFNDPGATAFDACDGNLTEFIEVDDSTVDFDTPGTYGLLYTVSDSGNRAGVAVRTIVVKLAAACITDHSADRDGNNRFSLSEILRIVQLYNSDEYYCDADSEDGYRPGFGDRTCSPHSSDFNPQDWSISLSELLRAIQLYNAGGFTPCPEAGTEDGFCPNIL